MSSDNDDSDKGDKKAFSEALLKGLDLMRSAQEERVRNRKGNSLAYDPTLHHSHPAREDDYVYIASPDPDQHSGPHPTRTTSDHAPTDLDDERRILGKPDHFAHSASPNPDQHLRPYPTRIVLDHADTDLGGGRRIMGMVYYEPFGKGSTEWPGLAILSEAQLKAVRALIPTNPGTQEIDTRHKEVNAMRWLTEELLERRRRELHDDASPSRQPLPAVFPPLQKMAKEDPALKERQAAVALITHEFSITQLEALRYLLNAVDYSLNPVFGMQVPFEDKTLQPPVAALPVVEKTAPAPTYTLPAPESLKQQPYDEDTTARWLAHMPDKIILRYDRSRLAVLEYASSANPPYPTLRILMPNEQHITAVRTIMQAFNAEQLKHLHHFIDEVQTRRYDHVEELPDGNHLIASTEDPAIAEAKQHTIETIIHGFGEPYLTALQEFVEIKIAELARGGPPIPVDDQLGIPKEQGPSKGSGHSRNQ